MPQPRPRPTADPDLENVEQSTIDTDASPPSDAPAATGDYLTEGDFDSREQGTIDTDGTDRDILLAELRDFPIDERAEAVTHAADLLTELDEEAEKLEQDIAEAADPVSPETQGQWQDLKYQRAQVQSLFDTLRVVPDAEWSEAKEVFSFEFAVLDRSLRDVAQVFRIEQQDTPEGVELPHTGADAAGVKPEVRQ